MKTMPQIRLGPPIPVLPVRHVEESLNYYVERLGFEVDFRYEKDPANYAGVKRDAVRLHMVRQDESRFENGEAGHVRFRIPVDDPQALFDEYRIMGVLDESVAVQQTEWGTHEFEFPDIDGNRLVFFRILQEMEGRTERERMR